MRANEKQKITLNAKLFDADEKLVIPFSRFQLEKQDITKSMQTSYLVLSTKIITATYNYRRTIIPFYKWVVEIVMDLLSFAFLATQIRLSNSDYIELVALCTQIKNITANEFPAMYVYAIKVVF